MPRQISVTGPAGSPFDLLTFAAFSFFATLAAGVTALKMLTGRREKRIMTASRFAAGLFLGTAMLDLLSDSDIIFHVMRYKYPVAFLLSCTGYVVAMLADCLIARAVGRLPRLCFKKYRPKSFDEIMLALVYGLEPTKCCDTTLPVENSKPETKDCDGIGYLRYLILYRAKLFVDFLVLWFILSVLSMDEGAMIENTETKTLAFRAFLNISLHNVIYVISLIFTALRSVQSIPFIVSLFFVILFSMLSPLGVVVGLMSSKIESSLGSEVFGSEVFGSEVFGGEAANLWVEGIFKGFCSGVFVYLSVHHLLADGYELEKLVSDTRFGKFVAIVVGVGVIALLKVLDI